MDSEIVHAKMRHGGPLELVSLSVQLSLKKQTKNAALAYDWYCCGTTKARFVTHCYITMYNLVWNSTLWTAAAYKVCGAELRFYKLGFDARFGSASQYSAGLDT